MCYKFDSEFANLRGVKTTFFYLLVNDSTLHSCYNSVVGLILVIALITIPPYVAEVFSKKI